MNSGELMRNVIIVMSLMGSAMFVLYLILRPLIRNFFSVKVRMYFILISIIFYLIPLPLFKNYYYDVLNKLFGVSFYESKGYYLVNEPIRILSNHKIMFSRLNIIMIVITVTLAIIFTAMMLLNYKSYHEQRRRIFSSSQPAHENDIRVIESKSNKNINNTNINIRFSDKCEPLTIGFFKPVILLPHNYVNDECIRYIIKHELAHLKHRDFFVKMLMNAVICMHWFNPLVYVMTFEANKLMEYYADEVCVIDMNKDEFNAYAETVITFSQEKDVLHKEKFVNCFGSDNLNKMKARINEMKKVKKHSKVNSIISCILLTVSVLSCSMIAFAYEDTPIYIDNDVHSNAEISFTTDNTNEILDEEFVRLNNHLTTLIFIDEDGIVYEINEFIDENVNSTKAICSHTYVSGTIQEHITLSNGGCTVKKYSGQHCSKCGAVIKGSLISSTTYAVCPH